MEAAKRSRALLRGVRWQLAIPFVALLVGGRLLEAAKAYVLSSMSTRFYTHLVEIPAAVVLASTSLSIVLAR